jgi:type I restriction enzyme R subunit
MQNAKLLENESFVEKMMMRLVIDQFKNKNNIPLDALTTKRVNGMLVKEYMNEFYGRVA